MKTTLTWAFTTWLALVALQALTTKSAPGRIGEFFADVDAFLERALDPTVPAIPDLRSGGEQATDAKAKTTTTTTTAIPRLPALSGSQRPV